MPTDLSNLAGALAIGICDLQQAAIDDAVDLDAAELSALLAVFSRPQSSVGEIAATTRLTHSGAVRVVDRLCAAGLVRRTAGQDRRAVALTCTEGGIAVARRALAARADALAGLLHALTPAEQTAMHRFASKLLARLPQSRADAWRICRFCDHAVCRGDDCPVGRAVP